MYSSNNKDKRIEMRNAEIESKISQGWKSETYKDVIFIWTDKEPFLMKAWKGTAYNHLFFYRYRSIELMERKKEEVKKSADYREERKEKRAREGKKLTGAALCAKDIREELKNAFPNIKFSVKSQTFSMGNSVHIDWTDGPTDEMVNAITKKYQYGHFNGMDDMYELSNNRDDLNQAKYVQTHRNKSEGVEKALKDFQEELKEQWPDDYNLANSTPWRVFSKCAFPADASNFRVVRKEGVTCGLTEDFYTIAFDSSFTETQKPKRPELKKGQIKAIEYSDKSIAVIGETKQFKDELKKLGGKFNFRLSCGAGWIFPKSKSEELKKFFESKLVA